MFQVHMMNSLSSWPSRCLSYDLCTPCLSGTWPLGIALCYFPVTIRPFKICGTEAKFSQVSHLEITAFFNLLFFLPLQLVFNEDSPSSPFGTFLLTKSSRASISCGTTLLHIYMFSPGVLQSIIGFYYIQFPLVLALSTFTTVLCHKN